MSEVVEKRLYSLAIIYAGFGNYDEAIELLEQAYEERSDWLVWMGITLELEPLRTEGHFTDLLCRVGFPLNMTLR